MNTEHTQELTDLCATGRIGESHIGLIVFPDGRMQASAWAQRYVADKKARYATPAEIDAYTAR